MKHKLLPSLADRISNILSSAPSNTDPEDDSDQDTSAKTTLDDKDADNDDRVEEELLSKFRKQNVDLLADVDERYAGKRTSRKVVRDMEVFSESDDMPEATESDIEDTLDDDKRTDFESDENDENDSEESEEDVEDDQKSYSSGEYDHDNFQHVSETDVSAQVSKGFCVKNQITNWENLLEMRIQLQKCLVAANKMPLNERYQVIKREMGKEYSERISETKNNLGNLLDKLLLLQNLVQKNYPETKKLVGKNKWSTEDAEDEEICSDTNEEVLSDDEMENEGHKIHNKKRKLMSEYENEISTKFRLYIPYRNTIIQKWHEKTRLTLMKSNSVSQSIVDHIEHTLSDRTKLLKRTQLRRSEYQIIGEKNTNDEKPEDNSSRISQLYNSEIFDDDDFYHQLLRELIEVKSAGITDPVQLGRQWVQLQNLRSKMKRKIDTKATKGRKIRYTVHTKLVNLMAPIDGNNWTDEAKDELYSSLFGKKQLIPS